MNINTINKIQTEADNNGFFGEYGGAFVPEELKAAMTELKEVYNELKHDESFQEEFNYYLKEYSSRETPLTYAENLTRTLGGAKIYLKREDLNHTGAHKINNAIGQALIAQRMGKKRLVAETGAGQHGVASATVAAMFDMEIVIFMGAEDMRRQRLNVFRMELLGAKVVAVEEGNRTLTEAVDAALEYYVKNVDDTHYLLGSALGPDPFPTIVRDFQSVIGREIKTQILEKENRLPNAIVACIGGGSNAIGTMHPFILDETVKLYGVEAAGKGFETNQHSMAINKGKVNILHGTKMYLTDDDAYSISAGLDYPGAGPEHCYYHDIGRVSYEYATDEEALNALQVLSKTEGIIPALESSHAVAHALKLAPTMNQDEILVVTISGRGDKDMDQVMEYLNQ